MTLPSIAELTIRSTGVGFFITAAGYVISGRRLVYYGADLFSPVRLVDMMYQRVGVISRVPERVEFNQEILGWAGLQGGSKTARSNTLPLSRNDEHG